jgi:HK97 family phage portal protein
MGILTSLLSPRAAAFPAHDDFWYRATGGQTQSGAYVGLDTGMNLSAVFQAVRLISETVGKVSCKVYERVEDKSRPGSNSRRLAVNNYLYTILDSFPNNWMQAYEYRVQAQAHILLRGNHYSQIVPGPTGQISQLVPLHPDRIRVMRLPNMRLGYLYWDRDGIQHSLTQDEIFHLRGPMLSCDDVTGVTPITYARETIGSSMTQQNYADSLFRQGALMRGNYSVPNALTTEQRAQMKEMLRSETAGAQNWHGTLVLENGATWVPMAMTAADAEFLTQRKYNIIEVARWFNVQPQLLMDLERSTFHNNEQQALQFQQITMLPHFVNWEQTILRDLILQPNRFFAEFLIDTIVRADIKTRYEAYGVSIEKGWTTRNEVREKENQNRLEGLDRPLIPQNMSEIDENGDVMPANQPSSDNAFPMPSRNGNGNGNGREQRQDAKAQWHEQVLSATAQEMVRYELNAILKATAKHAKATDRKSWSGNFYEEFARKVSRALCIDRDIGESFACDEMKRFINAVETGAESTMIEDLEKKGAERLLAFVMQEKGFEVEKLAHRNGAVT